MYIFYFFTFFIACSLLFMLLSALSYYILHALSSFANYDAISSWKGQLPIEPPDAVMAKPPEAPAESPPGAQIQLVRSRSGSRIIINNFFLPFLFQPMVDSNEPMKFDGEL
jgi:hypothetical protein